MSYVLLTLAPEYLASSPSVAYNCACEDDYPRQTLTQMRKRLLVRLGFAAQLASPPPGMVELCDDFLYQAQVLLHQRYSVFRTERFFTWNMEAGKRFYDIGANGDECPRVFDPRRVTWVGISQGDDNWRPLACGIDPSRYTSNLSGIPDSYEIRQCIEVWPAPADDTWKLRIKGHFELLPFAADDDFTTLDAEAVFLLALANAKAHYGQSDADNYMGQLTTYIGDLTAGSHMTSRYIPGGNRCPTPPPPKMVG